MSVSAFARRRREPDPEIAAGDPNIPAFLGERNGGNLPARMPTAGAIEAELGDHVRSNRQTTLAPEVASRDMHFRSADAIENDAQILRDHAISLGKYLDDGLTQVERAMVAALGKCEVRCAETRAALLEANRAHSAAVAEYLTLCVRRADEFRATGDKLLDYIKKADERLAAKRDAILHAGEESPSSENSAMSSESPAPGQNSEDARENPEPRYDI